MIVGLDARTIYQPNRRGTGKNLIDLYRHLAELRPDWRFVLFHRGQGRDNPFDGFANVRDVAVDIPGDRWNLWQQIQLPLAVRGAGVDVLHCPANFAPRWPTVPVVLTIHDLIDLDERFRGDGWQAKASRLARAARKAVRVVTPSEYTKGQIVRTLGVCPEKIIVNPWAADARCRRVEDENELSRVARKYGLDCTRRYVFGFGGADPRKNTQGILRAWAALPESLRKNHQLLLVGIQDRVMPAFGAMAGQLGIEDGCVLRGFADEGDIPPLLSGAAALCYPSLSEGFGLPILDAFVCRTPVLTSNSTSLPEVAGDAAVLVDAQDSRQISEGLRELLTNDRLCGELVGRGKRRVEAFTWSACAGRIHSVFDGALREVG